jgi:hypothetical protein
MKIKRTLNIEHRTSNSEGIRSCKALPFDVQRSAFGVRCFPRAQQRGMALIITVILLSVLTLMALAFLAISRRERGAVTTTTETASARLAADAALANAEAQILANVLSTTNPYNFGLVVSTNYINPMGFRSGVSSFTNVNYTYAGGAPLSSDDLLINLANLYYSPRPPVFIGNDFRFYLDLNRNSVDDPNGWLPETNSLGLPTGAINFMVGDPEWIGVLQRPDQPYGPNNPFVARFAFIAVPIGNALDLNYIHNQAHRGLPSLPMDSTVNPPAGVANSHDDIFIRNEGVGSWEINLAAFLVDLNTNQWGQVIGTPANGNTTYYYYQYFPYINRGYAFDDTRALLAYRYNNDFNTLVPIGNQPGYLFGNPGINAFSYDYIDGYTYGQPLLGTAGFDLPTLDKDKLLIAETPPAPWVGADNTNHFFTHQELFDTSKTALGVAHAQVVAGNDFSDRLFAAGTITPPHQATYDRYTFYRLLSQLGTDSTPEQGKMNLNYSNAVAYFDANGIVTNITIIPGAETNFTAWTPIQFFTIAADRMLRAYSQEWLVSNPSNYVATYGMTTNIGTVPNPTNIPVQFGISDIPVLVSNQFVYTPAVQRVLQLAANIYDATTNTYFPSVFRPLFSRDVVGLSTNLYITGYTNVLSVSGPDDPQLVQPVDAMALITNNIPVNLATNVYGVPWIIGAKKGFPNFNEFVLENIVGMTRRLNLTRDTNAGPYKVDITGTNQMYLLSLDSSVGLDFWNSYNSSFPDAVTVTYRETTLLTITSDEPGFNAHPGVVQPMGFSFAYTSPLFSDWLGSPTPWVGGLPNTHSLYTPLNIPDYPVLTNSVYRTRFAGLTPGTLPFGFIGPRLIPTNYLGTLGMTLLFETNTPGFPLPHFGLLTTNQLQVFILDQDLAGANHVIDYAHFEQNNSLDLNAEIFSDDPNGLTYPSDNVGIWNTNIDTITGVPYGIENQIKISRGLDNDDAGLGKPPKEDGTWQGDPDAMQYGTTPVAQQAFFQAFFQPYGTIATVHDSYGQTNASNPLASVQAPYAPTRYAVGYTILQANDPLVHYLASDLTPSWPPTILDLPHKFNNSISNIPPLTSSKSLHLGFLNLNYQPWGNTNWLVVDPNAYNLAERDPLVWQSDNWDFPTYKFPTVGWLGRVHRGTPWQTVYMKSPPVDLGTWENWTGDSISSGFDANNSAPVQDRLLFDLFTTAFDDNATRGQLSVNVGAPNGPSLAAWSALFSGVIVLSNNAADPFIQINPQRNGSVAYFTAFPIQPAGAYDATLPLTLQPPLAQIVAGINQTRSNFVNADGLKGAFEHVGDILAVPQLTTNSPFLNKDLIQQTNGISDEMYEWLPQQTMSLLRVGGSPQTPMRYVIYSYGQTLKPAPNSVYTGSGHFGMITNYQIVSETATRAVVRFGSVLTNPPPTLTTNGWIPTPSVMTNNNVVIESFNVLPPD